MKPSIYPVFARRMLVAAAIFFAVSFAGLWYFEGPFPGDGGRLKNFSRLIPSDLLISDAWYGVYLDGNYIGYAHSAMRARELDEGGGYVLATRAALKLPMLAFQQDLTIDGQTILDKNYELESADFGFKAGSYFIRSRLRRIRARVFENRVSTPSGTSSKTQTLSRQLVNFSASPLLLSYLPLKDKLSFSFLDPILDKNTEVRITRGPETFIELSGARQKVRAFALDVEGVTGTLYVDEKGSLLRQDFLGIRLIKEEPAALFKKKARAGPEDFYERFSLQAVDAAGKPAAIGAAAGLKALKIKISGIDRSFFINDYNQKADPVSGIVVINKSALPAAVVRLPIDNKDLAAFTREEDSITFKTNGVAQKAIQIAGDETDAFKVVTRVFDWVDKFIIKTPTLSLPSAGDTLRMGRGDCGELSALTAGFLRSLGLPAYVNIGVVYHAGRFFYHAWVSVWVGGWIDIDPGLSQPIADVTHIKLGRGLKSQAELFKLIDRIKIEVVEYD